ncbi:hypothetical protein [Candidatus Tisiphia endosymbiont of Hybos culiciformis]|uniref:hypothetical protein n=1 Tax=Candidatus Tisiphia endosymbiont of Hybos culiciformis TaxID=3139331 RepID=UPI003CCB2919
MSSLRGLTCHTCEGRYLRFPPTREWQESAGMATYNLMSSLRGLTCHTCEGRYLRFPPTRE